MSADEKLRELCEAQELILTGGIRRAGPTRRLRLRANRERPAILAELLRIGNDAIDVDVRDKEQASIVVAKLRALARRIEELP